MKRRRAFYLVILNWMGEQPSLVSAFLFGVVTIIAPWLILQPGLGFGICASDTPDPLITRAINMVAHTIFGLGLYLGWWMYAPIV